MNIQGFRRDHTHLKSPPQGHEYTDPHLLPYHLLEIGNLAIAGVDIDHVLRTVMDKVMDIYGAERGMIVLFGERGETLSETLHNLSQEDLAHPDFEVSRTMIAQVRRQGEPICLCYTREELVLFSAICLPLRHNSDVFGVLYLDHQTGCRKCQTASCVFFTEFADFISLAVYHPLEQKQPRARLQAIETALRTNYHFDSIVGHHPRIVEILQIVAQVADTDATVLIQGESGTGKELIARALHENSRRKEKPLIPVNCGALPDHLLESELFGHVRGAFTGAIKDTVGWFEHADGGTIFLDEVNDMSPALQVKLLRVLQTGEYSLVGSPEIRHCDVRVIAATSQDLQHLVEEGTFREEVYYRLNIVDLRLPPLCERKCDIPFLARHFLKLYGAKYAKQDIHLSNEAEMLLMLYDFPGQVRELENIIQRAVIFAKRDVITSEQLTPHVSWRKTLARSNHPQHHRLRLPSNRSWNSSSAIILWTACEPPTGTSRMQPAQPVSM